ncbi:MAG: hypothetical protein JST76_08545 [Bacteroidetes bacterium]|nr:hypothetical protein [Bacteroidota bacterium]
MVACLLYICSCSLHFSGTPTRAWSIHLRDSAGTFKINLPLAYDTMHTWQDGDDNPGDARYVYRIQSSKASMVEEYGFLKYRSDTFYSMTIDQYIRKRPLYGRFDIHSALIRSYAYVQQMYPGSQIDTLTITKGDLAYACTIGVAKDPRRNITTTRISASVAHNGSIITPVFESTLLPYRDTIFIAQSLDAIRSISFE